MTERKPTDLAWETDLPLLSRRMLTQWTLAMLATALVMAVLLGIVFWPTRNGTRCGPCWR